LEQAPTGSTQLASTREKCVPLAAYPAQLAVTAASRRLAGAVALAAGAGVAAPAAPGQDAKHSATASDNSHPPRTAREVE